MSRVILILILAVWLIGVEEVRQSAPVLQPGLFLFFSGYLLLVLGVALWARALARQIAGKNFHRHLRRFNVLVLMARWLIPAWLAVGFLSEIGWAQLVVALTDQDLRFPGVLLGTLPAFLAWAGIWWADFPADRAFREQNIYDELCHDLPVHMPPPLRQYLVNSFRQQLMPVIVPVMLILLLRDLIILLAGRSVAAEYHELVMLPAAAIVYLISPELLRWIFNARSLEASPLRQRLEGICRRMGLRYRDILLWQTNHWIANACVIGILPRWRYVLLSDRLLETMTDEQIEAVFAHEVGHMVHHHIGWFVLFFLVLMLAAMGPGQIVDTWIAQQLPETAWQEQYRGALRLASGFGAFAVMLTLFGSLSRRFERQADVFAARMMENNWGMWSDAHETAPLVRAGTHVGRRGAAIFTSALRRVAVVNNIPLDSRDWFHPSISNRIRYLEELSANPLLTSEFDRFMSRLYGMIIVALVACGVFLLAAQ